jgi:hypothetical protein
MALMTRTSLLVMLVMSGACTRAADQCMSDADCTDPAYPFCDTNGIEGDKDVCAIPPPVDAGVPVDSSGASSCSPGAMTCASNTLSVCNSDGKTTTTTSCALGCESSGTACKSFVPSNNLSGALAASSSQPDVTLPAGTTINTDTGTVTGSDSQPIQVTSYVVTSGSVTIRAFIAHSFTISGAKVTGNNPVAFVSKGAITIGGTLDASADTSVSGPGGADAPSTATGSGSDQGGGGGNATSGGTGNLGGIAGGTAETSFDPLAGGGRGGSTGTGNGGGGGGGIELVSLEAITVSASGIVDVGGGGGGAEAGAGAGGNIVFEAPTLEIDGIVAANGGGGGGPAACTQPVGQDGSASATAATGAGCKPSTLFEKGGDGATATTNNVAGGPTSGGGGAVGRIEVVTSGGGFVQGTAAIVSAAITTAQLVAE